MFNFGTEKRMKKIIFLLLFTILLLRLYPTQNIDDPKDKLIYLRTILSDRKVNKLFNQILDEGYIWNDEYIYFSISSNNEYDSLQIRIIFKKNNEPSYMFLLIDFIEYKKNKEIKIINIYISDN